MNTYPGFYTASDGLIYLFADKENYYSFERETWDIDENKEVNLVYCRTETNITREYLVNTKVEIESEGHEVFVREVASSANLKCAVLNGFAFIFDNCIEDASKQIHIPLPPKEPELKEWPHVGDEVLTASNTKAIVLGFHDNLVWIKYTERNREYNTVSIAQLKKPLTPEEGLENLISIWMGENKASIGDGKLAKAIINGEIEDLSYKPE